MCAAPTLSVDHLMMMPAAPTATRFAIGASCYRALDIDRTLQVNSGQTFSWSAALLW
jgi:hypothetical protein